MAMDSLLFFWCLICYRLHERMIMVLHIMTVYIYLYISGDLLASARALHTQRAHNS